MRTFCVIPARMASSRLPGKPMKELLGLPLVLHVLRRCLAFNGFEKVIVATCDQEIYDAVIAEGQCAVMTAETHVRCTDRTAEAIRKLELDNDLNDFVIMVQGDEILVEPSMLESMVSVYQQSSPAAVNLVSPINSDEDVQSADVVKIVSTPDGKALFLSRAPIPSRTRNNSEQPFQQTGIIGFSVECLLAFETLNPTPLEKAESVDMLRLLEHGLTLHVVKTNIETLGVDTPRDFARAEKLLELDPFAQAYLQQASNAL